MKKNNYMNKCKSSNTPLQTPSLLLSMEKISRVTRGTWKNYNSFQHSLH